MTELIMQRIQNIWESSNGPHNSADRVRNLSVIAHVDHGKTTLTDALLRKAGITNKERGLDLRKDEQELGVTIKSTPVTLALPYSRSKQKKNDDDDYYCINLIDSPGHADFSSEVTAALRLSDGALVVVDVVEGIRAQTETVLRQAIQERVRPVLFLNKIDRLFGELNMDEEQAYERIKEVIDSINEKLLMYAGGGMGDLTLDPVKGNVAFGSGYFKYGFRLMDFFKIYKRLNRLDKDKKRRRKFHKRLWGNYFYNAENDEWSKKSSNALHERGFNRFILRPIRLLHESIRHQQIDVYQSIIDEFHLSLPNRWNDLTIYPVKKQIEICISSLIPTWKPIVDMIVECLPSPKDAAPYRIPVLFSGPNDSPQYHALNQCDPHGPLTCFVSKLVPLSSSFNTQKIKTSAFVAVTRIFSGTLARGMNVQILGTDPYGNEIRINHKINRLVMMIGSQFQTVQYAPTGSLIGICGVDNYLSKSGTIVDDIESYPIRKMEFSVSPVVSKSVKCVRPKDLPKLVEGLKKLGKSDPLVVIEENVISCAGDFHLDRCLSDLQLFVGSDVPLNISEPIVHYMETIISPSSMTCISKSPNKLNRLYGMASPLSDELIRHVEEDRKMSLKGLKSNTSKGLPKSILSELNEHGWDEKQDGPLRKIWSFGLLQETQCNAIVDDTHGVNYLNDVRDSIINGFHHVCSHGVLTGEHLTGVNFQLKDAKIHSDPSHRNPGQIIPCAKHLFYASQLSSDIRLKEPLYQLKITYDLSCESIVHSILGKRQCIILDQTFDPQFNVYHLLAQLPVAQSFQFNSSLTDVAHGKAFCTFTFLNWWRLVDQDPLQDLNLLHSIRERNGLHGPLPQLQDYHVNL